MAGKVTAISELEREIKALQAQMRDERRGAATVNRYLSDHFGHATLRLDAEEDPSTSGYKFRVKRDGKDAHDLSEGECSLVAFCYFLARLQDAESEGKKLIIWIDDPISSLDGNHIFFVFSLIEALLAKPQTDASNNKHYRYEQLFIATHNLEFLKYLKRLSQPKNDHQHYVISRDSTHRVGVMPSYLRDYVTEFNFLFGEICEGASSGQAEAASLYNFGNNLRKFLEAYLYFKYPTRQTGPGEEHTQRVERFFGEGSIASSLITRLTNEFSHLAGVFERAVEPVDKDEIAKTAKLVLSRIREVDPDQYADLLKSVGRTDPLLA